MDTVLLVIKYLFFGFFGLIGVLIVAALLFGKRVITKWEYEAEFRNNRGREIGEFDIKMSRIDKEEPDFTQKTRFWLRHPDLKTHSTVRVWLNDLLILEGMVEKEGRVQLGKENQKNEISRPETGQLCKVECDGRELLVEAIRPD